MRRIALLLICLLALSAAQGCAVYKAAKDERTMGNMVDDEWITAQIKADFLKDDIVKYLDFDAASYEGAVYLVGEYESQAQIDRAKQIARGVEGVRSITVYMLPKDENDVCGTADNLELEAKLNKLLIEDKQIKSTNVDVMMVRCHMVLLGIVGTQYEIDKSIEYAHSVPGVRSVKSYLRLAHK